ncbi:helix-turn-helix transcriptional regulator [Adlercreutzia sp. R7]|uniref:Helix-turn-helix transcriptional regulator n=1 Tax=Adlercreutzia wanghongyangiae TaxID=3111451 RepID=A0ABU6IF79_9ACTN|nr:helix-turn-helix transcriptional regulator [Adlercreutzia sp. R7]
MLELLAQKGERSVGHDLSLRWVQERIPPPGRQNIGQVLKANGLDEYDEFALLMSSMGACAQDDFLLREVAPEESCESAEGRGGRDFEAHVLAREVGATLAQCRREAGMTQRVLSERTGVQQAVISRIERGRGNPTLDLVQALAAGMGVRLRIEPVAPSA